MVGDAAARFAATPRPWTAEPGCDRDHDAARVADRHLELVALTHRPLVDVAAEDQLGSGVDQAREHMVASCHRLLPRAPRSADQLVVKGDDAKRAALGAREALSGAHELCIADASGLVPPRPYRVHADDMDGIGRVERLGRLPDPFELAPRLGEARRERVRDVVIPRNRHHRRAEPTEEGGRAIVLGGLPPVRQIAGRNDQLRLQALQQVGERMLDDGAVAGPDMQIRKVEDARNHRRSRLYSE